MILQDQLIEMAALASKLKASRKDLSEANTKVTFIQPILETLGWKVTDPDEVVLEYPVYGGTRLDYALLSNQKAELYVEAKALRASMDEPGFIAQTVSYANNDGIRWCVLTNGLIWRIYKSDALAPADKKLLAEADIREAVDSFGAARVAATLAYLSKESITSGKLDEWGERVFVDTAVRRALNTLFLQAPSGLVGLVRRTIDEPHTPRQIRESLARLGSNSMHALDQSQVGQPKQPTGAGERMPARKDSPGPYTVSHHTNAKPQAIIDLFNRLDERLMTFGSGVERRILKPYISYKVKKSFATLRLEHARLVMHVALSFDEALKPDGLQMRDVHDIGHLGLGDTEVSISDDADLAAAEQVARASYEATAQ